MNNVSDTVKCSCRLSNEISDTMEVAFLKQILVAITIISVFLVIMLFLMICLPPNVSTLAWEKLESEELELGSRQTPLNL